MFSFCLCARDLFVVCVVILYGLCFVRGLLCLCTRVCVLCLRVLFVNSCVLSEVFVLFYFVCACARCLMRLCVVLVICL